MKQKGWRLSVKRGLDLTVALSGLLLLSPLLAVIALLIRLTMGRPVLFRQERPGLNGQPFQLVKFRTMSELRHGTGELLSDERRLTRLGGILRATSLDELPEFWNILRGDLSLVGPRPLLMQYLERYNTSQARRHEVLPGLTGWAQIHGRNAITWEQKFSYDVWYVNHWSLSLDARILWRTFWRVIRREGISQDGHVTMTEFMGSGGSET